MLTQADLRSIESIVKPIVDNSVSAIVDKAVSSLKTDIISEVGEMVEENILPQFTQLRIELLTQLPSKAFIADKLADLEGSVIARQRKEDQKVNLLIEFLQTKKVLAQDEVNMLKAFEVFPSRTTS